MGLFAGHLATSATWIPGVKSSLSTQPARSPGEEEQNYFRVSEPNPWTAIVEGLDVARALNHASAEGTRARAALREVLRNHPVLCLRNGKPLDRESYMALASIFGQIKLAEEKLIFKRRKDPSLRPEDVSPLNVMDSGTPGEAGNVETRTTPTMWHTDDTYTGGPAFLTSLYAVSVPSTGGNTDFVNMQNAYETLDAETKRRLDGGLSSIHSYARADLFKDHPGARDYDDTPRQGGAVAKMTAEEDIGDWAYPFVQVHPLTGARTLYGVSVEGSDAKGVVGLDAAEARELMWGLMRHAVASGGVYSHVWQPHDVLLWDNLRVNHRANNDFPLGEPRVHHKLLIKTLKTGDSVDGSAELRISTGRKVG